MENDIVVKICGEYPDNFKSADVGNNPNFVFENDPLISNCTIIRHGRKYGLCKFFSRM